MNKIPSPRDSFLNNNNNQGRNDSFPHNINHTKIERCIDTIKNNASDSNKQTIIYNNTHNQSITEATSPDQQNNNITITEVMNPDQSYFNINIKHNNNEKTSHSQSHPKCQATSSIFKTNISSLFLKPSEPASRIKNSNPVTSNASNPEDKFKSIPSIAQECACFININTKNTIINSSPSDLLPNSNYHIVSNQNTKLNEQPIHVHQHNTDLICNLRTPRDSPKLNYHNSMQNNRHQDDTKQENTHTILKCPSDTNITQNKELKKNNHGTDNVVLVNKNRKVNTISQISERRVTYPINKNKINTNTQYNKSKPFAKLIINHTKVKIQSETASENCGVEPNENTTKLKIPESYYNTNNKIRNTQIKKNQNDSNFNESHSPRDLTTNETSNIANQQNTKLNNQIIKPHKKPLIQFTHSPLDSILCKNNNYPNDNRHKNKIMKNDTLKFQSGTYLPQKENINKEINQSINNIQLNTNDTDNTLSRISKYGITHSINNNKASTNINYTENKLTIQTQTAITNIKMDQVHNIKVKMKSEPDTPLKYCEDKTYMIVAKKKTRFINKIQQFDNENYTIGHTVPIINHNYNLIHTNTHNLDDPVTSNETNSSKLVQINNSHASTPIILFLLLYELLRKLTFFLVYKTMLTTILHKTKTTSLCTNLIQVDYKLLYIF